jgi:hypothetical protein
MITAESTRPMLPRSLPLSLDISFGTARHPVASAGRSMPIHLATGAIGCGIGGYVQYRRYGCRSERYAATRT